jgi:hypothetical protein
MTPPIAAEGMFSTNFIRQDNHRRICTSNAVAVPYADIKLE